MLKLSVIVSASALLAIALGTGSRAVAQDAAPAQAATPVEAAAPPAKPPEPVKGPMAVDATSPVIPTAASLAEAKGVYSRDCALCHGDNGNGKTDLGTSMQLTMSDWTDPKALSGRKDGELFNMIRVGDSKMPGEDTGRAKDAVVWNMIDYIRSLSKAQGVVPVAAVSKTASPASK